MNDLSFAFPRVVINAQDCYPFQVHKFGPAFCTCSPAVYKSFALAIVESMYRRSAIRYWGIWKRCQNTADAHRPAGGIHRWGIHPTGWWAGPLMDIISRICIFLVCSFLSSGFSFPRFSSALSFSGHDSILWMRQEKDVPISSLVVSCTAGKVKHSLTHTVIFHSRRNHGSIRDLLVLGYIILGEGWRREIQIIPLTLSSVSNFDFLLLWFQWCVGLLPDSWTSIKGLSFMGDCVNQCSPEAPKLWLRGARASSKGTFRVHSQHQSLYMPITWYTGRWDDSWISPCIFWWQNQGQVGLLPSSQCYAVVFHSAT